MNERCILIAALAVATASLSAGQTRTAEIEAARDLKERKSHPEGVSSLENLMLQVKQRKILERLTYGHNGLRVQIGNLATGGGFAAGPQFFREDLADSQIRVRATALISTRSWHKYEAAISAPRLAGGRLALGLETTKRDYRALEYYGSGPDSKTSARTAYGHKDTFVESVAAVHPADHIRFGSTLGGLWVSVRPGNRDQVASIETRFDDATAPGLASQSTFLYSSIFGQIDYRDDSAAPKSGGNYVSEYTWFSDQNAGAFSFRRWDLDAQQYIPFFNRTRRFALRARMSMLEPVSGGRMPFYLQPRLGGSDDLRGFRPYRFTDRNAVVYNAEYRWEVFSGLDGAVFFDAGKVMPRRTQLAFGDLELSTGFGLRFNAGNRVFMRADVGFSHEGTSVWLKFNDPFLPRLFGAGTRQPLY